MFCWWLLLLLLLLCARRLPIVIYFVAAACLNFYLPFWLISYSRLSKNRIRNDEGAFLMIETSSLMTKALLKMKASSSMIKAFYNTGGRTLWNIHLSSWNFHNGQSIPQLWKRHLQGSCFFFENRLYSIFEDTAIRRRIKFTPSNAIMCRCLARYQWWNIGVWHLNSPTAKYDSAA